MAIYNMVLWLNFGLFQRAFILNYMRARSINI